MTPTLIADPLFWVCAVPAVLLTGISKSGLGGAVGGIAVPLMAVAIAPATAAGVMLPILIAMDLLNLWHFRGRWDRAAVRMALPGATIGIVVGAVAFALLDARWVRLLLGVECIVFAWHRMRHAAMHDAAPPAAPRWRNGLSWGGVSGFTSFIAHAGGPPMLQFLLPLKLAKEIHVGTLVVLFTVINLVKLPFYAGLGLFAPTEMATSAVLIALVPVGMWMGLRILKTMRADTFTRVMNWGMLATGVQLLVQAA